MTKKILVVDYDQRSTARMSELLTGRGFEVMTAQDGQAGWDVFNQASPDLVIMEPMLSKIHGFELCQRIRSASEGRTPVIIVTGIYKDTIYKTEAMKIYGAFQYFEKPVDDGKLLSEIMRAIGEAPTEEEVFGTTGIQKSKTEPGTPAAESAARKKAANVLSGDHDSDLEILLGRTIAPKPGHASKPAPGSENRAVDEMLKKALKGFDLETGKSKAPEKHDNPAVRPHKEERAAGPISHPEPARPIVPEQPEKPSAPAKEPKAAAGPQPRPQWIPIVPEQKAPAPKPAPRPVSNPAPAPAMGHPEPVRAQKNGPETVKTPAPNMRPEPKVDRKPEVPELVVPESISFGGLYERTDKKKLTPKMAAGIGAAIVVIIVAFLVFKPNSSADTGTQPDNNVLSAENAQLPAAEPSVEPEIKTADTAPNGVEARKNNKQAKTKPDTKTGPPPVAQPKKAARDIDPASLGKPTGGDSGKTSPAAEKKPAVKPAPVPESKALDPLPANTPEEKASEPAAGDNGQGEKAANPGTTSTEPAPANAPGQETTEPQAGNPSGQAQNVPAQAAPTVLPGQLVELSEAEKPPVATKKLSPVYPEVARKFRVEGTITVNALINEFGKVIDTRIIRGIKNDRGLHGAAEDAVRKWKFTPAYIREVPVKVWMPVVIVFSAGEMR